MYLFLCPCVVSLSYVHNAAAPGLGQACAVVALSTDATGANRETVENVAKRLAMHVVAASPMYLSPATVSPINHQIIASSVASSAAISVAGGTAVIVHWVGVRHSGFISNLGHDAVG